MNQSTEGASPKVSAELQQRDEALMREAMVLARQAAEQGEVPVGAILMRGDECLAVGCNHPVGSHDPSAHAEMVALREAASTQQNYRLPETTLYVTLEPCVMCVGAMVHARVERLVFGAYDPKTGMAGSVADLVNGLPHNHQMIVRGGVLADECGAMLQGFFRDKRAAQKAEKMAGTQAS